VDGENLKVDISLLPSHLSRFKLIPVITAIIVDDEPYSCESLATLLERYCPDVKILDICYSGVDALKAIREQAPTLLFLDIEMPGMNGFEMLRQLPSINFHIIFTTSYDQYAIKAIRVSALDYLLKPIDHRDLAEAIRKLALRKALPSAEQYGLLSKRRHPENFQKIAVPTAEGFELIAVDKIVRCEADDNYTHFHLQDRKPIIACRTLKEVEDLLESFSSFIRVHHSGSYPFSSFQS